MKRPWFIESTAEAAAKSAWEHATVLDRHYTRRANRDRLHQLIYVNRQLGRTGPYRVALDMLEAQGFAAARLNITKAKLKTLQNKIAKYPSGLRVNPDGANYLNKEKAQRLDQFLSGTQKSTTAQLLNQQVFRDGGIAGTGCVMACIEDGRPVLERVRRRELLVDGREGRDGKPQHIHRLMRVPRSALLDEYADDARARDIVAALPLAPRNLDDEYTPDGAMLVESDLVQVCWSHARRCGDRMGKALIHSNGHWLAWRDWKYPRLPYAFFLWEQRLDDFWSPDSFVDELKAIQWKLNEAVADLQAALYFGANPVLMHQKGQGVNLADFQHRRKIGRVEFEGAQAPQIVAFNPVAQQKIDFIGFLLRQADEITGVSQMAQSAKNPLGANASGRALEEFDDRESERHWDLDFNLSLMWKDAGDILVDAGRDANEHHKEQWPEGSFLRKVPWDALDMDAHQYEIQLEAANFFPETRSGKLAGSERLMQAGVIKGPEIPGLMDYPDLRDTMAELTAPKDSVDTWLDLCGSGDVQAIDPTLDIDLGEKMAINRYRRVYAETDCGKQPGSDKALQNYRKAIQLVQAAIKKRDEGKQLAVPPGGALGGGLPAMGGEPGALPPGAAPETLPGMALPGVGV